MDKNYYKQKVSELSIELENTKKQLRDLVLRVPSHYLTNNKTEYSDTWIYESPDGGKTTYRRKFGDYDNKEIVEDNQQLNLFK